MTTTNRSSFTPSRAKAPEREHYDPLDIKRIAQLAGKGELVAVVGTGVSIALTDAKQPSLSWIGLIRAGFSYAVKKGTISKAQSVHWRAQLKSTDMDEILGAAEFMCRKLGAPHGDLYARWLEQTFNEIEASNNDMINAIRVLHAAQVPLCTLNYDTLLEKITDQPTITTSETARATAWMRQEASGILHLHGSWDVPESCIVGIRDYDQSLSDDVRNLMQRSLSSFRRLLFIGCGDTLADPNFSALVQWLRKNMKAAAPQHFALVLEKDLAGRHADANWRGFVEPISYGPDYQLLPSFLTSCFKDAANRREVTLPEISTTNTTALHADLLETYRKFLIKDCGQMTIEGVRADMDTAQRRFDLERLFVPLKVSSLPPEIPYSDPEREKKLLAWQENNKDPVPFGKVFSAHKALALLALPGGGKTLLLKRLAVAYADSTRLDSSSDELPYMDLIPVLIRCREWREHIRLPIGTLLERIPDITGQFGLRGLSDALMPRLKEGRVLLLVDGLDEIHDDAGRATFADNLEAFLGEYPLIQLVVTSREAGFGLVAPCLARFCIRWRVAPLDDNAIISLCDHWHRLMVGETPEAIAESTDVAQHMLRSTALRRLAENPLLLTMLLVVKHGAGRLPPDRVSLYGRAVEVLLDTWNIKGHDPLNPKEAIPQLAFVAFQLMRSGKQTATERELLALLEEAREKVPQIRRYAKDSPYDFLKRVELRSSLLLEAGHQVEAGLTVPFYQFRHLTFQEYLSAVASVESHYMEYEKGDSVLTPLNAVLTMEKWKEVVPMAAVLARKQAEPLMAALVVEGNKLKVSLERKHDFDGYKNWIGFPPEMPAAIARLIQCLVEEAEAAPETLLTALQLVALFARGCHSEDDWQALCRGPYAEELLHQALLCHLPMSWVDSGWLRFTCAVLSVRMKPRVYWQTDVGRGEIKSLLGSQRTEDIARGLLTCCGTMIDSPSSSEFHTPDCYSDSDLWSNIEKQIFSEDRALREAALWAWALARRSRDKVHDQPNREHVKVFDRIVDLWIPKVTSEDLVTFALSNISAPRDAWTPTLSEDQRSFIASYKTKPDSYPSLDAAVAVLAFHGRGIWSEEMLANFLTRTPADHGRQIDSSFSRRLLTQMGSIGSKRLETWERQSKK